MFHTKMSLKFGPAKNVYAFGSHEKVFDTWSCPCLEDVSRFNYTVTFISTFGLQDINSLINPTKRVYRINTLKKSTTMLYWSSTCILAVLPIKTLINSVAQLVMNSTWVQVGGPVFKSCREWGFILTGQNVSMDVLDRTKCSARSTHTHG